MQMLTDRFDPKDPSVQEMTRRISANPDLAPQYGLSLAEVFALQSMIKRLQQQRQAAPQTTVAEDLAQQAQQLMGAREQGVASLPVSGFNFEGETQNLAHGGIVAFADGGLNLYGPKMPFGAEAPVPVDDSYAAQIRRLQEDIDAQRREAQAGVLTPEQAVAQRREMFEAAGIKGVAGAEREKELRAKLEAQAADREDAMRMGLARFGFGMAAEAAKPGARFVGSAAAAAPGALTEYAKSLSDIKKLEEERKKELATIDAARRAEDMGVVKDASAAVDKSKDRLNQIDDKLTSLRGRMAETQAGKERSEAEIKARAEEGKLDRTSRERVANAQIAANKTLEEFRQAGNVDASMLADYRAAMDTPEAEREAALKAWEDKYTKMQKVRTRSLGTTLQSQQLRSQTQLYIAERKAVENDVTLKPKDKEARLDALDRKYLPLLRQLTIDVDGEIPPSDRPAAGKPAAPTLGGGVDQNNPLLRR